MTSIDPPSDHYGLRVHGLPLTIECGGHEFSHEGMQEGPLYCPFCGRRFRLMWNVLVEPYNDDDRERREGA